MRYWALSFVFGIFQTLNESYHVHTSPFPPKTVSQSGLCHIVLSRLSYLSQFWHLLVSLAVTNQQVNIDILGFSHCHKYTHTHTRTHKYICFYVCVKSVFFACYLFQVPSSCDKLSRGNFSAVISTQSQSLQPNFHITKSTFPHHDFYNFFL